MKNSRDEEVFLHDDISNFTEDVPMTQTFESALSELDDLLESIRESVNENELQNISAKHCYKNLPISSAADCKQFVSNDQVAINIADFDETDDFFAKLRLKTILRKFKILASKNLTRISKSILKHFSKDAVEKPAKENSYLSKIYKFSPFGIFFIVLGLSITFKLQSDPRIFDGDLLNRFKLDSRTVQSVFDYQLFTYSLVHLNIEHLISNLVLLSLFGTIVELKLGTLNLLSAYISMCYFVGLGWFLGESHHTSIVGASGAAYGLMTIAFLVCLYEVLPIFLPRKDSKPMKYRFWNLFGSFIAIFAICSLYLSETIFFPNRHTATDAHIIGSIIGIPVFILIQFKNAAFRYFCDKKSRK